MSDSDERFLYCKPDFLNIDWNIRQGAKGCTIVDADEYRLCSNKPAPGLQGPPLKPTAPKTPPPPPKSLIEGLADLRAWMNEPPKPKPPKREQLTRPKVAPFDIQDIPRAMETMGWKRSAKLMRRWFAGELNYATPEGEIRAINQKGEPFSASMVDTTMFPMSWILGFPRANARYEELLQKSLYTPNARKALAAILSRPSLRNYVPSGVLPGVTYTLDAWEKSGRDVQVIHRDYQFQRNSVDSTLLDRAILGGRSLLSPRTFPDDLYGSLGTFSFYAAIDRAEFMRLFGTVAQATVTQVAIYMRDMFTFLDRPGSGSQYLGHWNRAGIIVVPAAVPLSQATTGDWVMYPVTEPGPITTNSVYYPVRNKDFRDWQMKHKRGGDLLLYSDIKFVRLNNPISVTFAL